MAKPAWQRLGEQLEAEKLAHARTRLELRSEIARWQRLAVPGILDLMATYPALRRLLLVLAEAAELADPLSGAPLEDTARVEYVAAGENASTSATERGVLSRARERGHVQLLSQELEIIARHFSEELDYKTHRLAQTIGAEELELELPPAPVCHRKGCRLRGRQQSYTAYREGCAGCGRSFDREKLSRTS